MNNNDALNELTETLNRRLDAIEAKLDVMCGASRKGLEWIGMLSEHIESLDEFRDEVRASLEPLSVKLDNSTRSCALCDMQLSMYRDVSKTSKTKNQTNVEVLRGNVA